ncbi:histidine kinase [Streptomyces sp. Ag109_O5-1]|nr:histidine kinase [Streptomyces sp. Ag109_O5-1]
MTRWQAARDEHSWDRTIRPWDAYFAVTWTATLAFVLGAKHPGWPVRLAVVLLLVPLVPWYAAVGRAVIQLREPDESRAVRYLAGAMVLFLPAAVLVGETRLMSFALIPQCFMTLRMRRALIAVTVINLAPVAGWALLWRPQLPDLFANSLFAVVTLVFSVVLGSWIIRIIRIIEQSSERAELIAELDAGRHEISRLSAAHGALAERERMAREIHDALAQGFTSLLMLVQAVEAELDHDLPQARRHLALMDRTARQNLAEARALVAGGAPADLDGASLPDALRRLVARHGNAGGDRSGTATPRRRRGGRPALLPGGADQRAQARGQFRAGRHPPRLHGRCAHRRRPRRRLRVRPGCRVLRLRSDRAAGTGRGGGRYGDGTQRARRRYDGDGTAAPGR